MLPSFFCLYWLWLNYFSCLIWKWYWMLTLVTWTAPFVLEKGSYIYIYFFFSWEIGSMPSFGFLWLYFFYLLTTLLVLPGSSSTPAWSTTAETSQMLFLLVQCLLAHPKPCLVVCYLVPMNSSGTTFSVLSEVGCDSSSRCWVLSVCCWVGDSDYTRYCRSKRLWICFCRMEGALYV